MCVKDPGGPNLKEKTAGISTSKNEDCADPGWILDGFHW
jgi:hypothetical protein